MYTIKHAAELTGVPPATLRAWERRYGVLAPVRTAGGYRLYDERTLGAVTAMQRLVEDGWAPRQAAAEVKRRQQGGAVSPPPPDANADERFGRLRQAAAELDAGMLRDVLDEAFTHGTFENVVDGWLLPGLQAIGADWAAGRLSVAGEHLAANAILRRLATAYDAAARDTRGPRLVLGMPPGVSHELGLFAFAVAARRAGLATTYLGANVPVEDWAVAVRKEATAFVVTSLPRRRDRKALASVVAAVRAERPDVRIGVGGRYQDLAPAGVERLGHEVGPAADKLARDLVMASANGSG